MPNIVFFYLMYSQLHRFIRMITPCLTSPVFLFTCPSMHYHPSIVVIFPCFNSSCLESAKVRFQFFCSFFFIGIGCEQLSGSPQIQMKKLTRDELLQVTML